MFCQVEQYVSGFGRKRCRGPGQTSSVVPSAECESWSAGNERGGSWRMRSTRSQMLLSGRGESTAPGLPLSKVPCQQPSSRLSSAVLPIVPLQVRRLLATTIHARTDTEQRAKGFVFSHNVFQGLYQYFLE